MKKLTRSAATLRRELLAAERVPYTALLSDTVVRTTLLDYVQVFRCTGVSFECADDAQLNNSKRTDVTHKEIFLPSRLKAGEADWARDRSRLWNTVEASERKRNSVVAREFQLSLPHELTVPQRLALAREASQVLAERHGVAVDLAVHDPKPDTDARNFHAHLLVTTREVMPEGLGAKAGLQMSWGSSLQRGLAGAQEMSLIRERFATLTNEALKAAGLEVRVDHRPLVAQGIDREPMPHISFEQFKTHRREVRLEMLERMRAQYRERIAAKAAGAEHQDLASSADAAEPAVDPAMPGAPGAEEVRRRARDAWIALRRDAQTSAEPAQSEASKASSLDEDLGL